MGTEILIVFATCGLVFLFIIIGSLYRRKTLESKESLEVIPYSRIFDTVINGQRIIRIASVSQHDGQSKVAIYEIRLPKINDPMDTATITLLTPHSFHCNNNSTGGQLPPPFCIAINMPSPTSNNTFNTNTYSNTYSNGTDSVTECSVLPPTYNDAVPIKPQSLEACYQ